MHEIVHVAYTCELMYLCVEFWGEIPLGGGGGGGGGEECKTRENLIF